MVVGVRDLKKNLSKFLDRAARGEVIHVTDRGRPKAVLGPVPGVSQLERGIEEKWIRRGNNTAVRTVRRFTARQKVMEALTEDRGP